MSITAHPTMFVLRGRRHLCVATLLPILVGLLAGATRSDAATLVSQSRTVTLSQAREDVGYACYAGTTPACPTVLDSVPSTAGATAPDFGPFTHTANLAIGEASHASTLAPAALDLSGSLDLLGSTSVSLCTEPWCSYAVFITYYSGAGGDDTEVVFELDAPSSVSLNGSLDVSTSSLDPLNPGFSVDPTGMFLIELAPEGGPPVYQRAEAISGAEPSLQRTINEQVVLPAGVHRLRVAMLGAVSSELLVGAGGPAGTDVTASYTLAVGIAEQPASLPVLGWLWRGALSLMLCLAASRAASRTRAGHAHPSLDARALNGRRADTTERARAER